LARRLGATDAILDEIGLAIYRNLEPAWASALRYADAMTPTASVPSDTIFADLRSHWDSAQIVEITAVIGLFNYFNRFAIALEIPPTR